MRSCYDIPVIDASFEKLIPIDENSVPYPKLSVSLDAPNACDSNLGNVTLQNGVFDCGVLPSCDIQCYDLSDKVNEILTAACVTTYLDAIVMACSSGCLAKCRICKQIPLRLRLTSKNSKPLKACSAHGQIRYSLSSTLQSLPTAHTTFKHTLL